MKLSNPKLTQRVKTLRWIVPVSFSLTSIIYQLTVANWVHDTFGLTIHLMIEILFYGTVGPLFAYWSFGLINRWIEEKEQAEQQTRAMERRLASITNASADAILSLDSNGIIESWNRGAENLFGSSAKEALYHPFTTLLSEGEAADIEFDWLHQSVVRGGFVKNYETICWGAKENKINVDLTATNLIDDEGNHIGMSVILRDITNRKQREKEIQELNASLKTKVEKQTHELDMKVNQLAKVNTELINLDKTRSEFVSLVSHQIRAPLTNMSGAIERIRTDCQDPNPICTQMIDILDQQISRLDYLVQDVLTASAIESGKLQFHLEQISVMPVIKETIDQFGARNSNRHLTLLDKPGLPLVYADRNRVAEVLTNLLDNADKYSPQDQEVFIEVRADQTEVIITVRDCGAGLPVEDIGRVFDKYYRIDSSDSQSAYGYGLGLFVCRRLVEGQGGRIWAENHKNGGGVFSFTLPTWKG